VYSIPLQEFRGDADVHHKPAFALHYMIQPINSVLDRPTTQLARWQDATSKPPPFGELVLVRTSSYQAMAQLERPGVWRLANGNLVGKQVLSWQVL